MLKFEHVFEEDSRYGDLTVDIEAPPGAKIEFSISDNGIWLSANNEGFLHLARIFAELGTRNLEEGYHFHEQDWLAADSKKESNWEVTVALLHG
jgi:hypothetical protein